MLWIAIFLPRLASEALGCTDSDPEPVAVCGRLTVLQANERARAMGVHPGIRRATALALAPALTLVERDEARELETLRQVACWALQFTPSVSLQAGTPDIAEAGRDASSTPLGLLLEAGPSLRLFGGRAALLSRIRSELSDQGFQAQIACAPVAAGAWLLARHRDGLHADSEARLQAWLAPLPASLLEQARPHLATLDSVGARTLGDLRALPRAGLARRFGGALLSELDRAFGLEPEAHRWFEAPRVFHARLELLADVASTEALLFAARRLVTQLAGWLGARHAAVSAFELHGEHDDLPASVFTVRLAEASREASRLMGVLRETLAATRLPAPVHTLTLRCDGIVELAPPSDTLFPMPASVREELGRLIERLQARLGREQVQRLRVAADHRPEAACRFETVDGFPTGQRHTTTLATGGLPRPLWLLSRPLALAERQGRPWSAGPLALLAGPERIESGWWDGALVQRDYFIAADDNGRMFWIYRQRLPDLDGRQGWFVHGRFG
ncbi:MAG TPA: DNA polymerase Y family protein [Quisquiliibacterium sp.]|nr:DNA polymerase Y family protein [Quisquiliibacterium sp.]